MTKETTLQYQALQKGGPFALVSVPKPEPGPGEVSIRLKVIGLNPLDWKKLHIGEIVPSWPCVFGLDGAGIVEAVGHGVRDFKPGDEVFSLFGHELRASSFQEIAIVSEHFVGKRPENLTFEEAATLPICYLTAAASIYYALKIPLPFLPEGETSGPQPSTILVLGGSSGVGASAIQILRLALPTSVILTTSSPQHHEHLRSLGASEAFDRTSPNLVEDIKSHTPGGKGVEMIIDAVASAAKQTSIFEVLAEGGPKEYAEVFTGVKIEVPDGVKRNVAFGRNMFQMPGGKHAITALAELVRQGKYRVPLQIQNAGNGFEAIARGLEDLRKGVSGTKLVVTV
ncbi:hypothetical protein AJ80_02378 [Polytolypa hystricis UAMH7299]|uniref:Enoyl reductase (ER) domain-containing protein n=1 Tax=Polytolypa hystricis (strain UAMH7299) TaxID=1447883 RepID=A0A2B7YSK2_POLH7|nr:hypothetical protein AJ80_02378 [Polytolypa hystricis UAMH7299]